MKQRVPVESGLVLQGDVLEVLDSLPDESFHCGVTSPPYWKLRNYECEGQMGQEPLHDCLAWALKKEPCDGCYVCGLRKVFRSVWRVLRKDGVFFLNLGDSYNGSGGAGGDYNKGGRKEGQPRYGGRNVDSLKPKDMALVPERVALALQSDGWWVRNLVVWDKPNGTIADDRFSNNLEHVWVLTRSRFYFFDHEDKTRNCVWKISSKSCGWDYCHGCDSLFQGKERKRVIKHENVVLECPNCGSTSDWVGHFAAFPPELVEPCIRAATSEKGCCETCGSPMVRMSSKMIKKQGKKLPDGCLLVWNDWNPSCDCDGGNVPCRVLDLFAGSGTVGIASKELGRAFVGIDLKPEYVAVANARINES